MLTFWNWSYSEVSSLPSFQLSICSWCTILCWIATMPLGQSCRQTEVHGIITCTSVCLQRCPWYSGCKGQEDSRTAALGSCRDEDYWGGVSRSDRDQSGLSSRTADCQWFNWPPQPFLSLVVNYLLLKISVYILPISLLQHLSIVNNLVHGCFIWGTQKLMWT